MIMKVFCAWCRKFLYEVECNTNAISHGICKECKKNLLKELND